MSAYAYEKFFSITNAKWLLGLNERINRIASSLGLYDLTINPDSRFGVVIFCRMRNRDVVLKLVDMESIKGQKELDAIYNLKYSFMLKAIHVSFEDGFYLSEKAKELSLSTYSIEKRMGLVLPIFERVTKEWETNPIGCDTYFSKFESKVVPLRAKGLPRVMSEHIINAETLYKNLFDGNECRLSHGDLHEKNMLSFKERIIAIDPVGGYAPFEFEFTRFIENQLFIMNDTDEVIHTLDELIKTFTMIGIDAKRLMSALYIDSVERTSTSFLLDDSLKTINKGIDRINVIWKRI